MNEIKNLYLFRLIGSNKKMIGVYDEKSLEFVVKIEPIDYVYTKDRVAWMQKLDCKIHVSELAR